MRWRHSFWCACEILRQHTASTQTHHFASLPNDSPFEFHIPAQDLRLSIFPIFATRQPHALLLHPASRIAARRSKARFSTASELCAQKSFTTARVLQLRQLRLRLASSQCTSSASALRSIPAKRRSLLPNLRAPSMEDSQRPPPARRENDGRNIWRFQSRLHPVRTHASSINVAFCRRELSLDGPSQRESDLS